MTQRLFGTDGVRGTAGEYPLDAQTIARLGAALVRAMRGESAPRLLIGRDTRESSEWIEREFARGVRAEGAGITSVGVLPTPAVAYLTSKKRFGAGVVVSASHNPFRDNGIKIFSERGEKFAEGIEREIERIVADDSWALPGSPAGQVPVEDLAPEYIAHALTVVPDPSPLAGRRIAIDCANGATSAVAPLVFRSLGLNVTVLHATPDGRNINHDCGSTHPQDLAAAVKEGGHALGIAFDGDGDRAILVDRGGAIVDGDAVLLICAKYLQSVGRLRGNAIVATVMSNIGLELALRDLGIAIIRCAVGDKYVREEMVKHDLVLGGEQSGHVILSDYLFTGDGIVTALAVLQIMAATGRELAGLAGDLILYPQVLKNVWVRQKTDLSGVAPIASAMEKVEQRLAGRGRLLVRYSGTEPLLRVMVEGRDQREITAWAEEIAHQVRKHLG